MLLQALKEAKLLLDWRKKQRTRADVYTTVKSILDELPRAYTPELYQQKMRLDVSTRLRQLPGGRPKPVRDGATEGCGPTVRLSIGVKQMTR